MTTPQKVAHLQALLAERDKAVQKLLTCNANQDKTIVEHRNRISNLEKQIRDYQTALSELGQELVAARQTIETRAKERQSLIAQCETDKVLYDRHLAAQRAELSIIIARLVAQLFEANDFIGKTAGAGYGDNHETD